MKKLNVFAAALLCVMAPAAIAADQVSMEYDATTFEVPPAPLPGACRIAIGTVTDARQNMESVGTEFKPLLSGDAVPWVKAGLNNLSAFGFTVQNGAAPAGAVVVNASLFRSYTWHGQMRINGAVAMKVDFVTLSGQQINRKYRVSVSKNNWAGATAEYMTTLNMGLSSVVGKLALDLQDMCSNKVAVSDTSNK